MNEYETEDQQVEALKKWWKENSSSLIFGLLVGVSGLFGYRYYVDTQHTHAVMASDMYMTIVKNVGSEQNVEQSVDLNNTLINEFSDTPYASLSSMVLARSEYMKGNHDAAKAQLELAMKHATTDHIKNQIRFRLASIYIENEQYDQASSMLNVEHDEAYEAQFTILRGDLAQAKGNFEQAKKEYDSAIELQGTAVSPWLVLKRDNVGISLNTGLDQGEEDNQAASPSSDDV